MAHLSNYPWQRAYAIARRETDPEKLVARVEQAVAEIETRYAEWGSSPATKAEMKAIQEAISALQILLRRKGKCPPEIGKSGYANSQETRKTVK